MFYGNALAISEIASAIGDAELAANYSARAAAVREMYLSLLWNEEIDFFAVWKDGTQAKAGAHNATNGIPFGTNSAADRNGKWVCGSGTPDGPGPAPAPNVPSAVPHRPAHCPQTIVNYSWPCNATVGVRELLGLGPPWYFAVPPPNASAAKYMKSWATLFDPQGFAAKWGPTTVERRNRCFNWTSDTGECNWAGPSWPFETSRVITGLSNLLNDYPAQGTADAMTKEHYMKVLRQYAVAHTQSHPANSSLPYIGESIEPDLGFWQARQIMYGQEPSPRGYQPPKPDKDRSVDYNHSTFADLIIEGLIGLRAALGNLITVNPLATGLSWFAMDNIPYHNRSLTIAWDEAGTRNYKGCAKGLCVWADGKLLGSSPTLRKLELELPNRMDTIDTASSSGNGRMKNDDVSETVASSASTTLVASTAADLLMSGGAALTANPLNSLRSGEPHQRSVATFSVPLSAGAVITGVSFEYRYTTGFGPSGAGSNFTLQVAGAAVYSSPQLTDYSYSKSHPNYSAPVPATVNNLGLHVAADTRVSFAFDNNDRNVQLLLPLRVNLTCTGAVTCAARPALPTFLASNMVLQRAPERATLWGQHAEPGEKVSVTLDRRDSWSATANSSGHWLVRMAPQPASADNHVRTLRSARALFPSPVLGPS